MANKHPWLTSDELIDRVKKKIAFPLYQSTYSEEDILQFCSEELLINQVPDIMKWHEEYFVTYEKIPLEANVSRYAIPERAIGGKLRDIAYSDNTVIAGSPFGNLTEMTKIEPGNKPYFQQANTYTSTYASAFYVEGNEIVLTPSVGPSPTGYLVMWYYRRPSQLVKDNRAAISTAFTKTITVDNAQLIAGDTFTLGSTIFTAVVGAPSTNEFQIGATSIATAGNIVVAVNASGLVSAVSNGSPGTNVVVFDYDNQTLEFESDSLGLSVQSGQGIRFSSVPSNIANNGYIDFLKTKPGHDILSMNVKLGASAISGTIINFSPGEVPVKFVVGDYVCCVNECIIPGIPSDLHSGLAERAAARILAGIGDQAGLQTSNAKIADIMQKEKMLIDNRTEAAVTKINNTNSHLKNNKFGLGRRRY